MSLLNPHSRIWVFLFFFVSGATGLIYEVVWTRLLVRVMGNTHYSIATVLTMFMAGLAVGSYVGGRLIDRQWNPLAIYAVLEGIIGVYCFFIPTLIDAAFPLFQWVYQNTTGSHTRESLYRFFICGAILILPTTFMGATLPVLSKYVSRDPDFIGRDVGTLYSLNTFGAVFGALFSAFVFMRLWGIEATIGIAAVLNVGIALVILLLFKPSLGRSDWINTLDAKEDFGEPPLKGSVIPILLGFGVSGLCALIYQVAWNRILSLLLGSSVYAFSLILTTFILGLAVGTVCFSRWVNRFDDPLRVFGFLQVGIGFTALASLPLFGEIPFVNRWVYENWSMEFASIQWSIFLMIFSLLFLPTFLMGGQFPVVVRLVARDLATLGRSVGTVYASNTVGTIIGSFLGGFVLIPILGIQDTILMAILINVGLGLVLVSLCSSLTANLKGYLLPGIVFLCFWGVRSVEAWDKAVISSGSYMPYRIEDLSEAEVHKNKILFYQEGLHTTVTTELSVSGNIFLRVNGKTDASLALDMRTQVLSGYLPMLLSNNPDSVLVIGQGSGITLGSVEQFPVKEIDLVEISQAVIEGSRFFAPFNHDALEDPRVTLILEDGRNHVALTNKKYDVVISEPSNPWISGVGVLFTRDFFQLVTRRLNPGGLVCIWVHTNMSPDSFKSITRSFAEVFPHVTMWESIVGDDYLLIGSLQPLGLSYERIRALLEDKDRARDLHHIGVKSVRDLMSLMIMNRDRLLEFSGDAPLHTDDNSLLEFSAPRYIYKDERDVLVRHLAPFITVDPSLLKFDETNPEEKRRVLQDISTVDRSESQIKEIKRRARIDQLVDQAAEAFNRGDAALAVDIYTKILKIDDEHVMTYLNAGNVLQALNRNEAAESAYRKALQINPHYLFAYEALAKLYIASGKPRQAVDILTPVAHRYPGDVGIRLYLGLGYAYLKDIERAIEELEQALQLEPDNAEAHYYLGVQYQNRNGRLARKHLKRYLDLARTKKDQEKMVIRAEKLLKKL